jgi:hypothetical protein
MSIELLKRSISETGVSEMANDSPSEEIVRVMDAEDGKPQPSCGYGPCTVYDCDCSGFKGTSYICEYCKHVYTSHGGD